VTDIVLRKADIEKITGVTERTVRSMEAAGKFPKRFTINPSGRAVGWSLREVQNWMEQRIAADRRLSD
jgi:predicted DNA-binding transcriptional regulator AlpA